MVVGVPVPDPKKQEQADKKRSCDHSVQCSPADFRHGNNHTSAKPDAFAVQVDASDGHCPGAGNQAQTGIGRDGEKWDGQENDTGHQRKGVFPQKNTDP